MTTTVRPSFEVLKHKFTCDFTDYVSGSSMKLDLTKIATGSEVVGWRSKIRSLSDATANYSLTMRTLKAGEGAIRQSLQRISDGKTGEAVLSGNWLTTPSALTYPSHNTNVTNGVASRWFSKLADALTPFKGLVFLGELKETCALLVGLCKSIYNMFASSRRHVMKLVANFRRRVRALKRWARRKWIKERGALLAALLRRVSEIWLTWAFGITPLLADIESAAENLTEFKAEVRTVKATDPGAPSVIQSTVGKGTLWQGCASYVVTTATTVKTSTRAIGAVSCIKPASENLLADSASRWGLTFREFLPTAWELTPWSFLVDYFTNVGQILTAAAYHSVQPVYAVLSSRTEKTLAVTAKADQVGAVNGYRVSGLPTGSWMGEQSAILFTRTKLSVQDVGFSVKYPAYATQYANMLALLIAKITRGRTLKPLPE